MRPKLLNSHAIQTGFILLCTFILIIGVEAQVVTDGLVSYYTLDENDIAGDTVKDIIGGKDGTIIGQPKPIKGHLGDALDFGGQPDCVKLPSIFKIAENPATYEAWFLKTADSRVGWQYILTNKTDFFDHFFRLGFNQNTGQLRYYTEQANNVRKAWITDEDYADGKWHHVVATREGDKAKIYVDGVLVKEDEAMSDDIGGGETDWHIAQDGNTDGYLIGAVDEVRIYRKVLTLEEIEQNFKAQGLAVQSIGKLSLTWGRIKAGKSYRRTYAIPR